MPLVSEVSSRLGNLFNEEKSPDDSSAMNTNDNVQQHIEKNTNITTQCSQQCSRWKLITPHGFLNSWV